MPRVSVVLPVYCRTPEHEKYFKETLQSVAAQTYRDFEVVIVDDLSPIDIMPIIESIGGLPETRIIRNASNVRQAESRNIGVRASQGELIAFLDHDDIWLPEKLARQVDTLDANPDAAMVFCAVEIFGPNKDFLNMDQSIIPERPDFRFFMYKGNYTISASAVMARRQAVLDAGGFDPRYSTSDDFDAWLKILKTAPIVYLPQKLARYHLHYLNENYAVDSRKDSILLLNLMFSIWLRQPLRQKIKLAPRLVRKYLARYYFLVKKFWKGRAGS